MQRMSLLRPGRLISLVWGVYRQVYRWSLHVCGARPMDVLGIVLVSMYAKFVRHLVTSEHLMPMRSSCLRLAWTTCIGLAS
jgi:hypothetical protein